MKKIQALITVFLTLLTVEVIADAICCKVEPGQAYEFKSTASLAGDAELPPFLNKMLLNFLGLDNLPQSQWAFDIKEEVISDFKILNVDEEGNTSLQCEPKTRAIHALLTLKDAIKRDVYYIQEGTKVSFIVKDGDVEVTNQIVEGKPLFNDPVQLTIAPNGKILKFMGSGIRDHKIVGDVASLDANEKIETNNGLMTNQAEEAIMNGSLSFLSPLLKESSNQMPFTVKSSYQFEINQVMPEAGK